MPCDVGVEPLFLQSVFTGQQAEAIFRHPVPQRALLVADQEIAFAQDVDAVRIDLEPHRNGS